MARLRITPASLRALEHRLVRARPRPDGEFAARTGRLVRRRWARFNRPTALRAQVVGLAALGMALFVVALAVGFS